MGQRINRTVRYSRAMTAVAVLVVGLGAAACGSSSSSSGGSSSGTTASDIVRPPADPIVNCTYTVNGKVSPLLPAGKKPGFAPFTPDASATSALQSIQSKGGQGIVASLGLPGLTKLRSGPSSSAPVVATLSKGQQILLYDPVLWEDGAGHDWLAFFLACGGSNMYWAGLTDLLKTDAKAAAQLSQLVGSLKTAPSYLETGKSSLLPVVIDKNKHIVWKDRKVTFSPARAIAIA